MAARHCCVPFVVLTGLYKLCPLYPYPRDMDMYSNFEVIVAEGLPFGNGRYMADRLSKASAVLEFLCFCVLVI